MNIINSIKAHLYERTTSPLAGAFVLSWLAWNYRFVLIVFSDISVDEKFFLISAQYPDPWISFMTCGFLYPFLVSIAVILLYPIPAIPLYWYSRFAQMIQRELRQRVEKEKLLSRKESQAIILENLELQEEFSKQLKRKDTEIDALKSEMENLRSLTPSDGSGEEVERTVKNRIPEDFNLLSDAELKILFLLANVDPTGKIRRDIVEDLIDAGVEKPDMNYAIGKLRDDGFIEGRDVKTPKGVRQNRFYITQSGRAELQKYRTDK